MSMGGAFYRGLDDSAKNAAAVSKTSGWLLEGVVSFWEVWLALVNTFLRMELRKPPIPPTEPDVEERKRRAFADVDEFTVTIHKRSLYKKTKAERERA
ncbi:hypothetical protein QBC32DRAFT_374658 [Pseudoneurospora amorphoporcata]|uniref:Uncharacterized protein n=1 Tax=Pseudoneurospora amorphoporcata TaxID=241081 RepID=A0AAN6SAC4_9PEZI|nr:hypothetical protein QBC32DRAFT_374658 [Pseudoneurospora amorphoporcata]